MALLFLTVFLAVFSAAALLLIVGTGSAKTEQRKQIYATLEAVVGPASVPQVIQPINFRKTQTRSAVPLLDRLLGGADFVRHIQRLLKEAGMKWTPGVFLLMSLTCFAVPAYLLDLRTHMILVALPAGLILGVLPLGYVLFKRHSRISKFEKELPEALDLMVGALRVGHSFSAAISLITRECPDPLGTEFKVCFEEQNFGLDMRTSLENLVERMPLQDLRIVVTAILIQRESGGNLAELLEKASNVIRQRFRLKRQVQVFTAQGRLTGWILTLLPFILGAGLYMLNPKTMSLLWTTPIGVKLLIGAAISLLIGSVIIQKIIRIKI